MVDGGAEAGAVVSPLAERATVQVGAPRDRRRDLHDRLHAELRLAVHGLDGPVDAHEARRPRADRGQVVDDQRDLFVARPDVAGTAGWSSRATAAPETGRRGTRGPRRTLSQAG